MNIKQFEAKTIRRLPGDATFRDDDDLSLRYQRHYARNLDAFDRSFEEVMCEEENCGMSFKNKHLYEIHYAMVHKNVCAACKKYFITDHLLNLHIQEKHDSFFRVQIQKQTYPYECFVEGCKIRFANLMERQKHVVDYHYYPNDIMFTLT